ncbi:MAG: 16S rRNA (cytidine(1402)-2'-O)-methyltransferase [Acidimicrobiales bacterium]|nr:MAG: 16S rRNA (cytidine(1402)-2'-O)-methyltransferase [Acidimicrobiales bacterium]
MVRASLEQVREATTGHRTGRHSSRKVTGVLNSGRLVVAATPLGNPADASARLALELARADVIAAEDTRRLRRLAAALEVTPSGRLLSYYEGNERTRTRELVDALLAGSTVLLVTDAGMPSVSDPGYRLVRAAIDAPGDIDITALPGPSAVTTALALSGLACDRFCFEGFLPRKAGERHSRLAELTAEPRTMVFFEAPHRLAESLAALVDEFGQQRAAAVCRELTKTYEEVVRGSLGELAEWATSGVRGEITLVVAGAAVPDCGSNPAAVTHWIRQVALLERHDVPRKQAIAAVAELSSAPKREVYNAVVAAKGSAE